MIICVYVSMCIYLSIVILMFTYLSRVVLMFTCLSVCVYVAIYITCLRICTYMQRGWFLCKKACHSSTKLESLDRLGVGHLDPQLPSWVCPCIPKAGGFHWLRRTWMVSYHLQTIPFLLDPFFWTFFFGSFRPFLWRSRYIHSQGRTLRHSNAHDFSDICMFALMQAFIHGNIFRARLLTRTRMYLRLCARIR